jgi:hypothetical protein
MWTEYMFTSKEKGTHKSRLPANSQGMLLMPTTLTVRIEITKETNLLNNACGCEKRTIWLHSGHS